MTSRFQGVVKVTTNIIKKKKFFPRFIAIRLLFTFWLSQFIFFHTKKYLEQEWY